jgi:phosphoglycerol transferase MdoB-like AlkP superfamily enzyme
MRSVMQIMRLKHLWKRPERKYFENTIFVFVGDHGVSGNAKAIYG